MSPARSPRPRPPNPALVGERRRPGRVRNGQRVLAENTTRACAPDQNKVTIRLKPGKNTLLLKVTQGGGEWAFCYSAGQPTVGRSGGSRTRPRPGLGPNGLAGAVPRGDAGRRRYQRGQPTRLPLRGRDRVVVREHRQAVRTAGGLRHLLRPVALRTDVLRLRRGRPPGPVRPAGGQVQALPQRRPGALLGRDRQVRRLGEADSGRCRRLGDSTTTAARTSWSAACAA